MKIGKCGQSGGIFIRSCEGIHERAGDKYVPDILDVCHPGTASHNTQVFSNIPAVGAAKRAPNYVWLKFICDEFEIGLR